MRAVIRRSSPTVSCVTASARSASAIAGLALAAREGASAGAAEQDRGDEEAKLVHLAGVDERAREPGATFDEKRGDLAAAELGERGQHAGDGIAVDDEDVDAGVAERLDPLGGRVGRRDEKDGSVGGACGQSRVDRKAGGGVEDDTRRLPTGGRIDVARREQGVVREGRSDSDRDARPPRPATSGRAPGSADPEIHFESPSAVAVRPSRVRADFSVTSGRPVRACFRNGWMRRRAAAASGPLASSTSIPASRSMPGPRPLAFSEGSSER